MQKNRAVAPKQTTDRMVIMAKEHVVVLGKASQLTLGDAGVWSEPGIRPSRRN